MRLLKIPILTIMFLTTFCPQALAQPDQESFLALSWEGLSLNMSPSAIYRTLESDGYTLLNEQVGKAKRSGLEIIYSTYKRETDLETNTFSINEQDGVVTKIYFKGGKPRGKVKRKKKSKSTRATGNYASRIRARKAKLKKRSKARRLLMINLRVLETDLGARIMSQASRLLMINLSVLKKVLILKIVLVSSVIKAEGNAQYISLQTLIVIN